MQFLHRFFLFGHKDSGKVDIYMPSDAIDFLTWYKKEGEPSEGTRIQTNIISGCFNNQDGRTISPVNVGFVSQIIEGIPENVNQISFDGLFIKCTIQYVGNGGSLKKYTAWLNPDNVACLYSFQPDSTECFFRSGYRLVVSNKLPDFVRALLEHNKKYRERKKGKYGPEKKA